MSKLVKIHVRCRHPTCPRFCTHVRDRPYCNSCAKRRAYRGVLEVPCLTVREKDPYIKAAHYFARKPTSRPSIAEIEIFLLSCRPFLRRQADLHRCGWTTKEKVKAILATIYRQRGLVSGYRNPSAALLAVCAGTAAMTMPHGSQKYVRMQIARSVFHLLKAEWFVWKGKRRRQRVRLQSKHLAKALYDALRPFFYYWLEQYRPHIISRSKTYKPLQKRKPHPCLRKNGQ